MKCIILAGGYAKRLWPLTLWRAKPLLKVNEKPLIDYMIKKLEKIKEIDEILISTNMRFEKSFNQWLKNSKFKKKIRIIIEQTGSEKEKLGAIKAIQFLIEREKMKDDIIIIAGDNLFDFKIEDFIRFSKGKSSCSIAVFDIKDLEKAKLYGNIVFDDDYKITEFVEKPPAPKSTFVSTVCYFIPKRIVGIFSKYIAGGNPKDAPGYFIQWLYKREGVFAFVFNGHWFDIGDKSSLEAARRFMREVEKD